LLLLLPLLLCGAWALVHHHHHQITKLSHSINAIGPAPHRSAWALVHVKPTQGRSTGIDMPSQGE
jgi:hypothetical protein